MTTRIDDVVIRTSDDIVAGSVKLEFRYLYIV